MCFKSASYTCETSDSYVMSLMTDEEFLQQKISILDENDSQDTAIEIYDSLLGKEVAGWTLEKFVKKYAV